MPFKALIQASEPLPGDASLAVSDRLWVLPDILESPAALSDALLYEMTHIIREGGRTGLAARGDMGCDRVRNMLVMMLREQTGQG